MRDRPSIDISGESRKSAIDRVALARRARQARRLNGREGLVERLNTIKRIAAHRAADRDNARKRLAPALAEAFARSSRDAALAMEQPGVARIEANLRPARFILQTPEPRPLKELISAIGNALGLTDSAALSLRHLFDKLIDRRRDLANWYVLELPANRGRMKRLRGTVANTLRRTGLFTSVRAEGLHSGLVSSGKGKGDKGSDEAEGFNPPSVVDWHLHSPDTPDPDNPDFPGAMDAYGAWDVLRTNASDSNLVPGDGIKIGHPDTGFREHADYPTSTIDLPNAFNAFSRSKTPSSADQVTENVARHPIEPNSFPYLEQHGTFTASVIVAPSAGPSTNVRGSDELTGIAPGVTMVPLRCMKGVVLAGDTEIIDAVNEAIDQDVDILSISLGGAPHFALGHALADAVSRGMIVVAAAGQPKGAPLPNAVVSPANYPEVIAVGGAKGPEPWTASFHGPEVDFCAPAVHITHAGFSESGGDAEGESNGTSFSAALTAGAAALWLQFHGGRQAIMTAVPDVPLQQVFRHCARESARDPSRFATEPNPDGWDTANFGTGLINVRELLECPLPNPDDVPDFEHSGINPYGTASGIAFIDFTGDALGDGISHAIDTGAAGLQWAGSALNAGVDVVSDISDELGKRGSEAAAGFLGAVGSVSGVIAANLKAEKAADAWATALAAAETVGGELGEVLDQAASDVEEAWNEAEDQVDDAIEDAGDAIDDFVDEAGDFIESAGEEAGEAVEDTAAAIVGFVSGPFG